MGMLNNFKVNSLSKCIFQATIQTVLKKSITLLFAGIQIYKTWQLLLFFKSYNLKKKLKQVSDFGEFFVCWLSKSS